MDADVSAMNRISKIVGELSEKDRAFVVRWFVGKYAETTAAPSSSSQALPDMVFKDAAVKR